MSAVANVPTLTVRRLIAATAEELFDAWLDPASLAVWMRPGPTTNTTIKLDARVGGAFEIIMHTPGGPVPSRRHRFTRAPSPSARRSAPGRSRAGRLACGSR